MTRYECPISSCTWVHDDPGADPSAGNGRTIEEAAFSALASHMTGIEAVIRAHLETHSLLEWVQEVMRLQGEARDARLTVAVLLRKLGGTVIIDDADLAAEGGTLQRVPVPHGFCLAVR